jgi:protein-histidine pros-kinase
MPFRLTGAEAGYRGLLEAAPDAMVVVNAQGEIVLLNVQAEAKFGYRRDELLGQTITNIIPVGLVERVVAPHLRAPEDAIAQHLGEGIELYARHKDGSEFPIEVMLSPLESADGLFMTASIRDITKRKAAERLLARAEAQYHGLLEAAPDAMVVVNAAGEIVLLNVQAETQFGYPRDELLGQPVTNIIPNGFAEQLRTAHHGPSEAGFAPHNRSTYAEGIELSARRKNGSEFPIEIMLSPLESADGVLVTAAIRDISARKKAMELILSRDRAESANRAKSRYLAGVSHELRTPLNGILGYAYLLHMEGDLSPIQAQRVEAMLEAGKHLLEMITSILDLSQIEAGRLELDPSNVDPLAIATACLDLVRPSAQARNLRLSVVYTPDIPRLVLADPIRLRQILLNLLSNAVKFTDSGSVSLRLRVNDTGERLRIDVADTGPGIAPSQRTKLFRDFERLDSQAVRQIEGSGLGLALSAELAALMGGQLGYEDNPDGGSVFWLELPMTTSSGLAPPAEVSEAANRQALAGEPDVAPLKILLVDDVAMNRDIAGSFLRFAGHQVTGVDSGADAVEAAASQDFDVILMDVQMPGMDGLEATRRIRRLGGSRGQVPIVAVTAQAFAEEVQECRKAGMTENLTKPFSPHRLIATVQRAVAAGLPPESAYVETERRLLQLPVFDRAAFDQTAAFLSPEAVNSYLLTLTEQSRALLAKMRAAHREQAISTEIAEAVHNLAGSAGMFGMVRLTEALRTFSEVMRPGGAHASLLDRKIMTRCLVAAIRASLRTMKQLRSQIPGSTRPMMFGDAAQAKPAPVDTPRRSHGAPSATIAP